MSLLMEARGLVAIPVAAQNKAMFWDTIPVSMAAHSYFSSGVPLPKRDTSDTKISWIGAGDWGPPGGLGP